MKELLLDNTMVNKSMLAALIDIRLKKILKKSFDDINEFTWQISFKVKQNGNT